MRKARVLSQAVNRQKIRLPGHGGTMPETLESVVDNLPEKFKHTSTGCPMVYLDEDRNKLMLIFMSEHGAWALGRSRDIQYCSSCLAPFRQLYFILGQM
jgi:hypothetical protein